MSEADTLVGGSLCSCHNFDLQLVLPQLYHCETLCIRPHQLGFDTVAQEQLKVYLLLLMSNIWRIVDH